MLHGDSIAEIRADGIDVVGCREGKHEKDADFLKRLLMNGFGLSGKNEKREDGGAWLFLFAKKGCTSCRMTLGAPSSNVYLSTYLSW